MSRRRPLVRRLNPFSNRSVDRALEFKRSRRPVVEQLEDRRMLAIDSLANLLDNLDEFGDDLQAHLSGNPIENEETLELFELQLNRGFVDLVVEDAFAFLSQNNPIPEPVRDFLNDPLFEIPLLDLLQFPNTPRELLTTFAAANGNPSFEEAVDGLELLLDIEQFIDLATDELSSTLSTEFDAFFTELTSRLPEISFPIISDFNTLVDAAGTDFAELDAIADDISAFLAGDPQSNVTDPRFDASLFGFSLAESVSSQIFEIPQTPILGIGIPDFVIGVSLGGSIDGVISAAISGGITRDGGLTIDSGEISFGVGLTARGDAGLTIAGETIGGSGRASINGVVSAVLSPTLDTNGISGFQVDEFLSSSCYFDTIGGLVLSAEVEYLDPNVLRQLENFVSSIFSGRAPDPNRTDKLIPDTVLWSATLSSCDPAISGAAQVADLIDGILRIDGSNADDEIVVSLDDSDPANPRIVVDRNGVLRDDILLSDVTEIQIDAMGGNDSVEISNGISIDAIILGGDGNDMLLGGGGNDEISGDDGEDTIDGRIGSDTVNGGAGSDQVTISVGIDIVNGGGEDDDILVDSAALGAIVAGNAGDDTLLVDYRGSSTRLITFDGGADDDLIQLTGGGPGFHGDYYVGPGADQGVIVYQSPTGNTQAVEFSGLEPIDDLMVAIDLTIHASASDDTINVVNGPDVMGTQTTLVNFDGAFEEIRAANKPTLIVSAAGRNDQVTVNNPNPGAGLVDLQILGDTGQDEFTVTPFANGVQITVDGGSSSGSDRLNVIDSVGGRRMELRQDLDPESGSLFVADTETVFFSEMERLHPNVSTNPNLVVLKPDPFEPNDTLATAWYLGSGAVINVDPVIDPDGDVDFFRFVADETGDMDFQVFFDHSDGDIDIEVLDVSGSVIASSLTTTDNERIVIPVVADETYFLRVFGFGGAENIYNFTVLNTPAPVPLVVDLQETSDTGRNDSDDITKDVTATFDIILDDDRIDEFNLVDFTPDTTNDGTQTDGADYGVEVFNNGVSIGFAFFTGVGNTWQFTADAGDLNAGHNNFITAATWIRDRANPSAIGRGSLGPINALQVTLDTTTPPGSFGLPNAVDPDDGLAASTDSGVDTRPVTYADRVTSDTTPTFWGRAEADAIVRLFHDNDGDGVIDLDTDTFLGQTVAVPFDGNDAYPNGYWEITSALDLNEIPGTRDGVRTILMTAEDVAGNPMPMDLDGDQGLEIADGVDLLYIFLDTQGPQVTGLSIPDNPNTPEDESEYDLFDLKPSETGYTPLINQVTLHIQDLPLRSNADPNFLYEALVAEIAEVVGNYTLVGDHVGTIGITAVDVVNVAPVDGELATATVTLTFAQSLPDDRYTLTVSDHLVDPAGNMLDGESNASGPLENPVPVSGDAIPGGEFVARFTVDSRPEIGTYIPTTIAIDINGNFVWDPANGQIGNDATNVDLTFTMDLPGDMPGGFESHDLVFVGQFVQDTLLIGNNSIFVIDISGSTSAVFAGDPVGDLNGDGFSDTVLDAEIAGFQALLQQLIDQGQGNSAQVGLVTFETDSAIIDMDPVAAGIQFTTTPLADANGNGIRDIDELLMSLNDAGTTNFEAGLQSAIDVINGAGIANGDANVIFLSDGEPTAGGGFDDEVDTLRSTLGHNVRAFGVGAGANLANLQVIDPTAVIFNNTNELIDAFGGGGGGAIAGARPFDQLAVYGHSYETDEQRWLIDFDSDGVANLYQEQPSLAADGFNVHGAIPIAGNFDGVVANGDEIGLYYAGDWAFDFDHNFVITSDEIRPGSGLFGAPLVGDFDGDGVDDVAVFNNNQFPLRFFACGRIHGYLPDSTCHAQLGIPGSARSPSDCRHEPGRCRRHWALGAPAFGTRSTPSIRVVLLGFGQRCAGECNTRCL